MISRFKNFSFIFVLKVGYLHFSMKVQMKPQKFHFFKFFWSMKIVKIGTGCVHVSIYFEQRF